MSEIVDNDFLCRDINSNFLEIINGVSSFTFLNNNFAYMYEVNKWKKQKYRNLNPQ